MQQPRQHTCEGRVPERSCLACRSPSPAGRRCVSEGGARCAQGVKSSSARGKPLPMACRAWLSTQPLTMDTGHRPSPPLALPRLGRQRRARQRDLHTPSPAAGAARLVGLALRRGVERGRAQDGEGETGAARGRRRPPRRQRGVAVCGRCALELAVARLLPRAFEDFGVVVEIGSSSLRLSISRASMRCSTCSELFNSG